MVTRPATILGGLPVVATIAFGKDADTPNGPGEYWAEVEEICWRKRDGTAGKPVPEHIYDRAEKYDPYFSALIETIESELAYEAYEESLRTDKPEVLKFTMSSAPPKTQGAL